MKTMKTPQTAETLGSSPEEWLAEYGDYLYQFAFLRTSNREASEDLVQETLLAALKAYRFFEGRSSVKTWLTGIMKNKILEYIRNRSRSPKTESLESEEAVINKSFDMLGFWNKYVSNWAGTPDGSFQQREFFEQFQRCLRQLSDKAREAFSLFVIDEVESAKICEALEISESNLRVLIYRARMGLRDCIEVNWLEKK